MKKVSENYYVSSQISEEDLDGLKNEGFSLVVCNRPNGEEENQTDFELKISLIFLFTIWPITNYQTESLIFETIQIFFTYL